MSYEPPAGRRPQDRVELSWKKPKGYAHEDRVKDTIIVWGGVLAVVALSMVVALTVGPLAGIVIVYGGAASAVVYYERWKKSLPSPVIWVPATMQQGEAVSVDVRFPENLAAPVTLVEVVATEKRHSRGVDGTLRSSSHRLAAEPFVAAPLSAPAESIEQTQTFVGRVPDAEGTFRPMWFVAVHIRRNRFFSYVRAFPVETEPSS